MSYITNYKNDSTQMTNMLLNTSSAFWFHVLLRTGKCIYCKLNCFILCVFYTVDVFDIYLSSL